MRSGCEPSRGCSNAPSLAQWLTAGSAGLRPEFVEGPARCFRLTTFDNRGTGLLDKPEQPVTIARTADGAAGPLDALGVGRAHVIGISMGGMIAQEVGLRHPEKVIGLVLGCTDCGAPVSVFLREVSAGAGRELAEPGSVEAVGV